MRLKYVNINNSVRFKLSILTRFRAFTAGFESKNPLMLDINSNLKKEGLYFGYNERDYINETKIKN